MNKIHRLLLILLTVLALQPVQAQVVREVYTQILKPSGAPLEIESYKATSQDFDDGFSASVLLTEEVTLKNVGAQRIAAVEVQILYVGAFGELIDSVSETVIQEIKPRTSVVETFKSPLPYTIPIYKAVVFPSQVRIEPAGMQEQATIWRADSTDVFERMRRLLSDVSLVQQQ